MEDVLIPVLMPVVRRKNKKISEVPITFWADTRSIARPYLEEIFLFQTPAFPGVVIENTIKNALPTLGKSMVFAGNEGIAYSAVPVCQIFRNKFIRFYLGKEEFEPHYRGSFEWKGKSPAFTPGYVTHSEIYLENRDSEILFMRANINNNVITGESDRKFQQALNCIGIEE